MNTFVNNNTQEPDLTIFTIYDSKSGVYGQPQCAPNALSLIREYEAQWDQMVKNGSMLASHSEDYTIFKIGSFSFKTGKLETTAPESVVGFHEIKTSVMSRIDSQRRQFDKSLTLQQ